MQTCTYILNLMLDIWIIAFLHSTFYSGFCACMCMCMCMCMWWQLVDSTSGLMVEYQDGMSFSVLNYIYCCLLLLMWIFRTSAVTAANLFLQSKMKSKYFRKQVVNLPNINCDKRNGMIGENYNSFIKTGAEWQINSQTLDDTQQVQSRLIKCKHQLAGMHCYGHGF